MKVFLETNTNGTSSWNNSKMFGLAMPQIYGEVAYNNMSVKIGHFYTIMGYETVPANGNFFYSHAYTMQYAEPFTHTGALATYDFSDRWTFYGGLVNGWEKFDAVSDRMAVRGPQYLAFCADVLSTNPTSPLNLGYTVFSRIANAKS